MPIREHEQITSLNTSVGITVPAGARMARLSCTGGVVRFRLDAQAPTSTVGELLADGASIDVHDQLADVRVIKVSGTPVLDVHYFGGPDI